MTERQRVVEQVDNKVQHATRHVAQKPWVEKLARVGYAAKGFVYAVIGVLAVQAAIGTTNAPTDSQGALSAIGQQPFGRLLLALITLGLIGYIIWRFVQAGMDTEDHGSDAKGIATRIGYAISAVMYSGIALAAASIAFGTGSGGGGGNTQSDWTARILGLPLGRALVVLAGLAIVGVGVYQIYRAVTGSFRKELNLGKMSHTEEEWAMRSGRFGLTAHGIVFGLVGMFLVIAALRSNPQEARGLGGALQALAEQPFGPWLLGIVALGLIAYGLFQLVEARYRRMMFS
jgi:hypothetical protein